MVENVVVLGNLENSDHQMLEWTTLINLRQCEYKGTTKDYSKADYTGMRDRLRQIDWDNAQEGIPVTERTEGCRPTAK